MLGSSRNPGAPKCSDVSMHVTSVMVASHCRARYWAYPNALAASAERSVVTMMCLISDSGIEREHGSACPALL